MTEVDPWCGAWVWWSGPGASQRRSTEGTMNLDREHGDVDLCPHCGSNQRREDDQYRRTFMVEIRGLYDGGLFYECPDCAGRWHRWPEGSWLRTRAEPYVEGGRFR